MIDHLQRSEMFRRHLEEQERVSTDPEWVRRQMGKHQYSAFFCIGLAAAGAILFTLAFFAVGAI